jgi:uncharacterized RDD family membrane protein YckC
MTDTKSSFDEPPRGYLSDASKRKFTLTAGILGAAFLFGQFLLPMVFMVGAVATDFSDIGSDVSYVYPQKAAVLDDDLYYIVRRRSFGREGKSAALMQVDIGLTSEPRETTKIILPEVSLLAGTDRLWVLSKKETRFFADGELQAADHGTELAEFSPPFLYEGRPAVLERWPTSLALATFGDGGWQRGPNLALAMPDETCECGFNWAKAVADERGLHVFLELGSTLYYGIWDPTSEAEVEWQLASEAGESWWPVLDNGQPVVFRRLSRDEDSKIVGHRLEETGWTEFFKGSYTPGCDISAFSLREPQRFLLLAGPGYSSELKVTHLQGSEIVEEKILGEKIGEVTEPPVDRFEKTMIFIMIIQYSSFFLLPLLLAIILSALMRRHRVAQFVAEDASASHASITRRAIAQLIDALLLVAPPILGVVYASSSHWPYGLGSVEGFWGFVLASTPALAGFGLAVVVFFSFAYAEGKWGVTPGKWMTRIRVLGTDLRPCGTSRALVRNLLKVIDGFFNFTVGIMVVALSENWQRVGDMAARTVVVDARASSSGK